MDDKMKIHILQANLGWEQALSDFERRERLRQLGETTELGNRIHAMAEKLGLTTAEATAGIPALSVAMGQAFAFARDEASRPATDEELFNRPGVIRTESVDVVAGRTYEVSHALDWTSGESVTEVTDVTRPDIFRVIGVDGGGTAGIGILDLEELDEDGRFYTKITSTLLEMPGVPRDVLNAVTLKHPDAVAVEDFVTLRRSARLSGWRKGGKRAADTAAVLAAEFAELDVQVARNSANRVKKWGNAFRMAAAGIRKPGLPHAVDGARHALFLAVSAHLIEDPLLVQRRHAAAHRTPRADPHGTYELEG